MSGHTFSARLYVLRNYVLGWPRTKLARLIRERAAKLPSDDGNELRRVDEDVVRSWEKGFVEPSYVAKKIVAEVMGFRHDLTDPDESGRGHISPQGLIELARAGGVERDDLIYYWRETKHRALFKGNPGVGEWIQIIGLLVQGRQAHLFRDGTWCTHCGAWIEKERRLCGSCGVED